MPLGSCLIIPPSSQRYIRGNESVVLIKLNKKNVICEWSVHPNVTLYHTHIYTWFMRNSNNQTNSEPDCCVEQGRGWRILI